MGATTVGVCLVRVGVGRGPFGVMAFFAALGILLCACEQHTMPVRHHADAGRVMDGGLTSDGAATETPSAPVSVTDDAGDALLDGSVDPLQGIWLARSWGLALQAADGLLVMYEITEISCRPYLTLPYHGSEIPDLGATATLNAGNLVFTVGGSGEITATPLATLPNTCANGGTQPTDDPRLSFNIFWHNFREMYSSFDIRHVDWDAQYDAFERQVTARTTTDELFAVLCDMIQPFDDPHVNVALGEVECTSHAAPAWLADDQVDRMLDAVATNIYGEGASKTANDRIAYRVLPENLGYVFIPGMGGYADTPQADLQTAGAAMDEIVAAFADVDGVIIDLRINGGGDDGIGLEIANRFADQKRRAFSVQTRLGDGWTPKRDYYIEPEGPAQLAGPVVLLTSTFTVSAAEVFVLDLKVLPNVTVIGETTAGAFATMMYRNLPNGIEFTLPFDRTFADDGVCYEGVGIIPDIAVPFDAEAFIAGNDETLRAAVAYATSKTSGPPGDP